jgi:hypothetical protein
MGSEKNAVGIQTDFYPSSDLEADFRSPPGYAEPRVYWWWLEGNQSRKGVLSDLTEMKNAGIQGAILFDAGSSSYNGMKRTEPGPVFMSGEWRELFTYACVVADSLDMEISLNIGSGWNDGGPWVTPEETSKKMVWSELTVQGPKRLSEKLPMPEGLLRDERDGSVYYRPIAVLAMKMTPYSESVKPLENMHMKAVHSIHIPKTANGLGFDWDIFMKEEASPENDCHAFAGDVIDISDRVDADGTLNWQAPEGEYVIMRFGYTGTGIKVSTHSPGGGGLAIDYMSKEAMDLQYDHTVAKLLQDLKQSGSKSLKYLHDDSWELGAANWTHRFDKLFEKANGYGILPYLPVLTGRIIESRDVSNRFLYDFRRTIADLVWENHYKHFRDRAHADGCGIHPESGGPHPAPIDALKNVGLNDIPMGEFWIRARTHRVTPESRLYVKQPASAAHVYGKRFVQAEGPTSIGPHWEEDFAYMKPTLDRVYCEGLNRLVIHTYTHSPEEAGIPGNEYFAGTHFNPNVTWWKQAPAFLMWNSRVSFMLSQGLFVGDVCFYYGDNTPNQVPLKHVHEGLGEGYDYDVCNTEVILDRMTVRDGKIYLPDGMSYEVLVLPDRTGMTPEVIAKLEKLVREGATVAGFKPITSVGLRGDKKAVAKVKKIADAMWGATDDAVMPAVLNDASAEDRLEKENAGGKGNKTPVQKITYGKGAVYAGGNLRDVLSEKGVLPDFTYKSNRPEALIDYLHRKTDEADIYYVVNRNERPEFFHASFRIDSKTPELWNPITGEIKEFPIYLPGEGKVSMPMFLEPFGSVLVVFRKDAGVHYERISLNGTSLFPELPADTFAVSPFVNQGGGRLLFVCPGEYALTSSAGEVKTISVDKAPETEINTPWNVSFDPQWGGPEKTVFRDLTLWNTHEKPGIRYYSGTAVYTNTFETPSIPSGSKRVYLDLGEMYNIAEVCVNGKQVGVWWQPPFTGDITDFLVTGQNVLEIKVINLWPNRLIGDNFLPENERFTKTNVTKFTKDYPLRPSGLAGPVKLISYAESFNLQ